ncbi:hypothetical protein ACFS5M_13395 [Lacinutrix iliipiscaria]|uniref:T9SS C-terminal target domain-containing protein n=1 Tax=Lacinutrix iliipiscaria TaxID=1230532 RepID=A0ABW5WQV2_9FLAO
MKHLPQILCLFFLMLGNAYAQQEKGIIGTNNWLSSWTEFRPDLVEYGEATEILTGTISTDTKLLKKHTYMLLGDVFVTNNAVLTIEPGTVIIGDFKTKGSLTITKGATIIADGLETDPIVFTSNRSVKKAGDWGGLIILGDAPINTYGGGSPSGYNFAVNPSVNINYGGDNIESNSGILRYVRIEYAGKRKRDGGNFYALLLAGIGTETTIDNVMVSYSAGNSVDVFGGQVYLEKMVSYKSNRLDYNFSSGAQCDIYNSLAIRSSYISNSEGSRCMNIKSNEYEEDIDFSKKETSVTAINLTLINVSDDLDYEIKLGLVKEAIYVGKNTSLNMKESVISGFSPAVLLENKIKINNESLSKIKFQKMYFNNCNGNIFTEYNNNNEDLENWYGNSSFFNVYSKGLDSETFIDIRDDKRPDFRLRINKIIASNED